MSNTPPQPASDLEQLRAELARLLAAGAVRWEDVGRAWRPWVDRLEAVGGSASPEPVRSGPASGTTMT